MSLSFSSEWPWFSLFQYVAFFVGMVAVIEGLATWKKIGRLMVGAWLIMLIAVLTNTVWPFVVCLCFVFASYQVGQLILSLLHIKASTVSGVTIFLLGAGAYGTGVSLLAYFPINYPGLYGIAIIVPLLLRWNKLAGDIALLSDLKFQSIQFRWLDLAIAAIAIVHFLGALMPEVGHDALAMHLFIPGHMAHRHQWGFDVDTYVWAVMPMLGDWIYSFVFMLAGETAAQMINVSFVFVLCYLLRDLVVWAGGNALGARWAILIFLVTPLTYTETSSLFIELIWTAFIVAGALAIFKLVASTDSPKTELPIAGFMLGCGLAAKAVTFTILPVLLLLLLVRYRVFLNKHLISTILLSLAFFLMIGVIPYLTAWFITGNPVFPFFNGYFQASQYPSVNFSASKIFEKGVSWDTLYRITFDSGRYLESTPGAAGFQWLLLLLPSSVLLLVSKHQRGLVLIIVGILAVVITFQQTAYLRYILPSYIILGAAIGVALSLLYANGHLVLRRVLVLTASVVIGLNFLFFKSGTSYGNIALTPLLSEVDRQQYLQDRLPIRNAIRLINQLNTGDKPVAVFSLPYSAGLNSDAHYVSWYNYDFRSLIKNAKTPSEIAQVLLYKDIDYIILDEDWGKPDKRLVIKQATNEILSLGSVSVRRLKKELLYTIELLKDSFFQDESVWAFTEGVERIAAGVVVSRSMAGAQWLLITPRKRYLHELKARCLKKPTTGRLQINWVDSESQIIDTHTQVFECNQRPNLHTMEVIAPEGALYAVIYATGHTDEPIVIEEMSFRK